MTLRVAVLTTDTAHHRWFLRQLVARPPEGAELVLALYEERAYPWARKSHEHVRSSLPNVWKAWARNPYRLSAADARRQAEYEEPRFFPDGDRSVPDLPVQPVHSVNGDDAVAALTAAAPDVLAVYGTGIIRPHVPALAPLGAVNAHGGLLPDFRGLDTNLWAALEGRPEDMAVTLHVLDEGIDTGAVHRSERLTAAADLSLATLRFHTTQRCTAMYRALLADLAAGTAVAVPQEPGGRYFGPMPLALKRRADRRLRAYAATAGREDGPR